MAREPKPKVPSEVKIAAGRAAPGANLRSVLTSGTQRAIYDALNGAEWSPAGTYEEVDGEELLRGRFNWLVEQLDLAGEKTPDERAWFALGVASGLEALRIWPAEVGDGVRGLRKLLPMDGEDPIVVWAGSSDDEFAVRYRVACAKLCAILAAATGEVGRRLVVASERDPATKRQVVHVAFSGEAALKASWDFARELERHKVVTMRRLRVAALGPPPSVEESLAKMGAALEGLDEP